MRIFCKDMLCAICCQSSPGLCTVSLGYLQGGVAKSYPASTQRMVCVPGMGPGIVLGSVLQMDGQQPAHSVAEYMQRPVQTFENCV